MVTSARQVSCPVQHPLQIHLMRYLRDWESDTWLVQARVDLRGRGGMGDNIMIEIYKLF